ncbi:MAG: hypothetical protein HYW86_02710 [Candidatus Roizmanbacteria bacterium]|nr:MAG: hypothetical protein HYW86_02710 [Candidatus Roizmanbacteria bacterium]
MEKVINKLVISSTSAVRLTDDYQKGVTLQRLSEKNSPYVIQVKKGEADVVVAFEVSGLVGDDVVCYSGRRTYRKGKEIDTDLGLGWFIGTLNSRTQVKVSLSLFHPAYFEHDVEVSANGIAYIKPSWQGEIVYEMSVAEDAALPPFPRIPIEDLVQGEQIKYLRNTDDVIRREKDTG